MSAWRRLSLACSVALGASVLVVAPVLTPPAGAAELLSDGGFEASTGTPPNSPSWTETDSAQGTPLCPSSNCSSTSVYTPPRTGAFWARFGGPVGVTTHTASLSQSVTIPSGGTAVLTYWYRNGRVETPFDATLQIRIDGTTLKTHTEASVAESAYTQQTVNIPAQYVNGASHTISFNYVNNSGGDNRMGVDDVSLTYTAAVVTGTPTVASTTPASPNPSTTPLVKGSAETGSTVTLYSNSTCTSSALGSGTAASFAGSGITATVPANATTTIWAKATKSGQTASACSSTSVAYRSDSTAPPLVTLTLVTPSPRPTTAPVVKGTAEAGSTVKLYATSGCTGSPVATGTAAAFASPGLTATVVVGTTTTFKATATDAAGNTSACSSSSVSFLSDLLDGGFEAATGDPANSPVWTEADSLAWPLCTVTTCTPGDEIAPHAGSAWAWFGGLPDAGHTGSVSQVLTIPVGTKSLTYWYRNSTVTPPYDAQLLVKVDGTTIKTLTEASADESAYSKQVADLSAFADGNSHTLLFSYVNGGQGVNNMLVDDIGLSAVSASHTGAPTVTATTPASPSSSTTPLVTGTSEAGTRVTLYSDAACSSAPLGTGTAAAFASPGITASVPVGVTTTIYAMATKAGQDDSACSTTHATYTQRYPAPDTTLTKTPKKKVHTRKDRTKVVFAFSSPTAGAAFECSLDGKAFHPCVSGRKVKVKLGKHTFAVRAVALGVRDGTPATYSFKVKKKH